MNVAIAQCTWSVAVSDGRLVAEGKAFRGDCRRSSHALSVVCRTVSRQIKVTRVVCWSWVLGETVGRCWCRVQVFRYRELSRPDCYRKRASRTFVMFRFEPRSVYFSAGIGVSNVGDATQRLGSVESPEKVAQTEFRVPDDFFANSQYPNHCQVFVCNQRLFCTQYITNACIYYGLCFES